MILNLDEPTLSLRVRVNVSMDEPMKLTRGVCTSRARKCIARGLWQSHWELTLSSLDCAFPIQCQDRRRCSLWEQRAELWRAQRGGFHQHKRGHCHVRHANKIDSRVVCWRIIAGGVNYVPSLAFMVKERNMRIPRCRQYHSLQDSTNWMHD